MKFSQTFYSFYTFTVGSRMSLNEKKAEGKENDILLKCNNFCTSTNRKFFSASYPMKFSNQKVYINSN